MARTTTARARSGYKRLMGYPSRLFSRLRWRRERSPADGLAGMGGGAPLEHELNPEARDLLRQGIAGLHESLPPELCEHIQPLSHPRQLSPADVERMASGYLPNAWHQQAAKATGPPSLEFPAMEAPGTPGINWPNGRPDSALERRRLYELQVDWLAEHTWTDLGHDSPAEPEL